MTTTKYGITCQYIRSNEVYDIYLVSGNGVHEYVQELRNTGITEENILDQYYSLSAGLRKCFPDLAARNEK